MKMSNLGFKNVKIKEVDSMYPAQDILMKTSQIKQYGSGIYAFDNIPLLVMDNIENVIKKHFNRMGCVEVIMPILHQQELWQSSSRWDKYVSDGVMLVVDTDKNSYGLAPTAEEAITNFVNNRITSYKQLPVYYYQIDTKFRNELRNRGYLYRGKEFLMFDLYTFDKTEEDMNEIYDKIRNTYFEIFEELGLTLIPVAADNGAIGGSKSEEMMVLSESGEDTILYDENSKQGINIEVLDKENAEEYLLKYYNIKNISTLKKSKAIELGHIFALGTKYSQSMDIKYVDCNNKEQPFYMGCYGIGVSRVLGLIYENNTIKENDQVIGYSLPLSVTPYYLTIIYHETRKETSQEIYNQFIKNDIPVIIDDTNATIGEKIRNAKILGIPYIAILGKNTKDTEVELEKTKDNQKEIMDINTLYTTIENLKQNKEEYHFNN